MQKKGRGNKRIKKEGSKGDLKIYDPNGKLIYIAKPGFNFDFQELIGVKRRKSKISEYKGSY